ncbi:MAG: hypothetical protein V7725_03990 [Porticoccus sp.]
MTKYSLISIFLLLFWSGCAQSDNNNVVENDAVSNERPPLTGDDLAKYWGLNCQQIATTTQGWAEKELLLQRPDMDVVNWRGLELCGMIYNVRDTGRYQPCPNYGRALLELKSIRSGKTEADPLTIAGYLTSCDKSK